MTLHPTYRLLALCARAESHPAFDQELADQLRGFTEWKELPAQAEAHGMAPLLWHHLRNARVQVPEETARILRGLYLRHRVNNQIHARVLMEILGILGEAGIQPQVLKGLALAYQYYPDPALRPVSDIDLLVRQCDFIPALKLLSEAGFDLPLPSPSKRIPKSIGGFSPTRDGIRVMVELHYYDPQGRAPDGSPDDEFAGFDSAPVPVTMDEGIFYTSTPLETLLYLSRHLARHLLETTAERPLQLKWVADIISLVERHAGSLDWSSLQQDHPDLMTRLEVFYSLTPIPPALSGTLPIRQVPPPEGCSQYPSGWPHHKIHQWKRFGFWRFLRQTFTPPSVWWLRLYYGISERNAFWYGHVVYPLQIPNLMFWAALDSIGW
jgi:hypothetical protein